MDFSQEITRLLGASLLKEVDFVPVEPDDIEAPYRDLLHHGRDMTSTLAEFHGGKIALKVLKTRRSEDKYLREVILYSGEKPVEYGLIEVHLNHCRDDLRERILAEAEPLGGILNDSGIAYQSKPVGFLKVAPGEFSPDFFPPTGGESLFGRYNTLFDENKRVISRILEILPREKP